VRIDHPPTVELLHDFAERHSRAKPAGLARHRTRLQRGDDDECA